MGRTPPHRSPLLLLLVLLPLCVCQVAMNTVDSMENFLSDIIQGRWESVLPQVAGLQLPQDKLLGKRASRRAADGWMVG